MDEHHPAQSIFPFAIVGLVAVIALSIAVLFLWSPWDAGDDSGPGQGGSDVPTERQIAEPTPPLSGTPNP